MDAAGPKIEPVNLDDDELRTFLTAFSRLSEAATRHRNRGSGPLLGDALEAHLGVPPAQLAVVSKEIPGYRFPDYDVALANLAGEGTDILGIGGGDGRHHMSLSDMVGNPWHGMPVGQVDWANVPITHEETRRVMALGIRLFRYQEQPVAVLQRRASRMLGNGQGQLEVLCPDPDVANELIHDLATLSIDSSLLRGNVLSLEMVGYEAEGDGFRFLPRPDVRASDVILPPGVLERVVDHITGVAEHAETLRRHGQHLKRGILLYGPPGTGKTHTVRHLIGANPHHTVILLAGETLRLITQASAIARHLQPSIVVLEDCDLVAMDRDITGVNPLLFEVLDALDGLDSDADVAFLLTTNRVEVLEEALAQRPGRVDLAVEIPPPDAAARRRLLELYRKDIDFSSEVLDEVAERSDSTTASFFKELVRRSVLLSAVDGVEPDDAHLLTALDGLLSDQAALSRSLMGSGGDGFTYEEMPDPLLGEE